MNRRLPVPQFTTHKLANDGVVIETQYLRVTYTPSAGNATACAAHAGFDAACGAPCSEWRTPKQPSGSLVAILSWICSF